MRQTRWRAVSASAVAVASLACACGDREGASQFLPSYGDTYPIAKGASHFATTTSGCGVVAGFPIPREGQPTSQTSLGLRIEDGKDEAEVDCQVARQGDGFAITGMLQFGACAFSVAATIEPAPDGGYTGNGSVEHIYPDSPTLTGEAEACEVTVLPNQDVAPGRVWGSFACDTVSDPTQSNVACSAAGSFVFENCEQ